MITLHNEGQYRDALYELNKIFQDEPLEGSVEAQYFDHLVEAIIEWENINYPLEDQWTTTTSQPHYFI